MRQWADVSASPEALGRLGPGRRGRGSRRHRDRAEGQPGSRRRRLRRGEAARRRGRCTCVPPGSEVMVGTVSGDVDLARQPRRGPGHVVERIDRGRERRQRGPSHRVGRRDGREVHRDVPRVEQERQGRRRRGGRRRVSLGVGQRAHRRAAASRCAPSAARSTSSPACRVPCGRGRSRARSRSRCRRACGRTSGPRAGQGALRVRRRQRRGRRRQNGERQDRDRRALMGPASSRSPGRHRAVRLGRDRLHRHQRLHRVHRARR